MDEDHRVLVQRLFALATEILEDAHGTTVRGQSHKCSSKVLNSCARELNQVAQALAAVATVISFIGGDGNYYQARTRRKRQHSR